MADSRIAFETRTKNWILRSVWDSDLRNEKFFSNIGTENFTEKYVEETINKLIVKRVRDEEFQSLRRGQFIVVKVTERNPRLQYMEMTRKIALEVEGVKFGSYYGVRSCMENEMFMYPRNIIAFSELAEVLAAVTKQNDVLIITGGYGYTPFNNEGAVVLNFRNEKHLKIIRVSECENTEDILLAEKVEPLQNEDFYKFSYYTGKGKFRRTLVQHRFFSLKGFCHDVSETLAFSRSRCSFPVPLVQDVNSQEIYNLLLSPNYRLPEPGTPKSFSTRSWSSGSLPSSPLSGYEAEISTDEIDTEIETVITATRLKRKRFSYYRYCAENIAINPNKIISCCRLSFVSTLAYLGILMLTISTLKFLLRTDNPLCPATMKGGDTYYCDNYKCYPGKPMGFPINQNGERTTTKGLLSNYVNKMENEKMYDSNTMKHQGTEPRYNWVVTKMYLFKDWTIDCLNWVKENCGLECTLRRLNLYIDAVMVAPFQQ